VAKPWEKHHRVIVETYYEIKSGKSSRIHARPVEGQGFSTSLDVRCSRQMRSSKPIGSKFKIYAKLTDREGGGEFLSTHHNWPWKYWDEKTKEWIEP